MPPKRGDYKTNGDVLKKHSLKYSTKKNTLSVVTDS